MAATQQKGALLQQLVERILCRGLTFHDAVNIVVPQHASSLCEAVAVTTQLRETVTCPWYLSRNGCGDGTSCPFLHFCVPVCDAADFAADLVEDRFADLQVAMQRGHDLIHADDGAHVRAYEEAFAETQGLTYDELQVAVSKTM